MEWFRYKLPLQNGSFREGIILRGDTGWGEIAPLPGWSRETLDEAEAEAKRQAPPSLPSVQFAFDCLQAPLPHTLSVAVNALETPRPGFSCLKVKVGDLSPKDAISKIQKLPKDLSLRVDFNRAWSLPQLLEFARAFSPTDFEYLEEPAKTFEELLQFSRLTQFPIALDESIPYVPYETVPTLKALVVKPTLLGSIPKAPPSVKLIFSSSYESGIGHLHLARLASIHSPNEIHGLDPYTHLRADVLLHPPLVEKGRLEWKGDVQLCPF